MGIRLVSKVVLLLVLAVVLLLPPTTNAFGGSFKYDGVNGKEDPIWPPQPFLNDTFENDTVGSAPKNWNTFGKEYSLVTDNSTAFLGNRSAKFLGNSTLGTSFVYRYFTEQMSTTLVTFALKVTDVGANFAGVEVYVDDDNFTGSNIVFSSDMTVQYREPRDKLVTIRDRYSPDRWYKIEFVINIPQKSYQIHMDDCLVIRNANFTGPTDHVNRLAIRESSKFGNSTAYIDQVIGYDCIRVPEDFPTIQQGIDAAAPGQGVYVSPDRTYFESIVINKTLELIGGNGSMHAVIDGHFNSAQALNGISIVGPNATDIKVHGFVIRNSDADGIFLNGSSIIIYDNVVDNSRGNGVHVAGPKNSVQNNTVTRSLKCGVYLESSNCTVKQNIIRLNLWGVRCENNTKTKDNIIYQNMFVGNTNQSLPESDGPIANRWDRGYPFSLDDDCGGNYWSDFDAVDTCSGMNQNQSGSDGICDAFRGNQSRGATYAQDNYPLFLIQNFSLAPKLDNITYNDNLTVIIRTLKDVPIQSGLIFVNSTFGNSTYEQFPLKATGQPPLNGTTAWNGTIPSKNYGTAVQYYASFLAFYSENTLSYYTFRVNSTRYTYNVIDNLPPYIRVVPTQSNVGQVFNVTAVVTEPSKASGVDQIILSWSDAASGTSWNGTMTKGTNDTYNTLIPKQFDNQTLKVTIHACDKAGNWNHTDLSVPIKNLANMSLIYAINNRTCDDPCKVDFGVMSRSATATNSSIAVANRGNENLTWSVSVIEGAPWLTANPTGGTIQPGTSIPLKITVNTLNLAEPVSYIGELSLGANGSTPTWTIIVVVKTRYVVVDQSWGSSLAPSRSNVGDTQNYAYHVVWAHNSSDVVSGSLTIANGTQTATARVNATGWAVWNYSSQQVNETVFNVLGVNFNYIDSTNGKSYTITSFLQEAPVLDTIWDRVNITIKIPRSRIDVSSNAYPSFDAVYAFSGEHFNGSMILTPTYYDGVSPNNEVANAATRPDNITVIRIIDSTYNLTAFRSNTVNCVWDRIRIIGGGVSSPTLNSGESGTFWVIAAYEYDHQMFKGGDPSAVPMAQLYTDVYDTNNVKILDNVAMNWSNENDRWEFTVAFDTPGTRTFEVSGVRDYQYNLTRINDSVGPLSISWGQYGSWWQSPAQQPVNGSTLITWQQNPLISSEAASQLWVVIVAVLLASSISVLAFWTLGKRKPLRKHDAPM